jgi:hypothetical protein
LQIFAKDGKFPFTAMAALYVVNNVLWICLRIVGYGWMIYSAYGMLRVACAPHEWMMTCKPMMHGVPWMHTVLTFLLIGCGLMWLLQFIWGIALFEATVKYITKRGKVSGDSLDRGQGDGQAKLVAKAKDRKSRIKAALNEACTTPHTAAPHPSNEQKKAPGSTRFFGLVCRRPFEGDRRPMPLSALRATIRRSGSVSSIASPTKLSLSRVFPR